MSEYKISIIIPVYNVEQYLDDAMNSILNQTIGFENLQVIFADDCSKDKSREIIDTYEEKYPNVLVIHLCQNSGAAGTPRNEALNKATAPYVIFWDPDDYYINTACEFLYDKVERTGAEIVYGDHMAIDEDNKVIYEKWPDLQGVENRIFELPQDLAEAVRLRDTICTKIYNRNFLVQNEIDFPAHIPGQDLVFYCKCLVKAKQIQYFSMPVYVYRIRSKKNLSISHIKTQKYFDGIEQCYRMCYEIFKQSDRLDAFDTLIYGVLDDYTAKMIDSPLSCETLSDILKRWQWIFIYVKERNIKHIGVYSNIILFQVTENKFYVAATVLEYLRPLRAYLIGTLDGKTYLQQQVKNYQISQQNEEKIIKELKSWTKELENGKAYLEQQVKNYQISDKNKEKVILELKNWTKELEEAKSYLEEQWNKSKKEKEEVEKHCSDMERQFDELNNIISKQKYKLNMLLNDSGVQKIIKKKKYDV